MILSFYNMLIYLVIYIPFILCAYYDFVKTPKEMKNQILWFWVIVFTLFRGLRWKIGTDWDQFYYVYRHAHWENVFSFDRYGNGMLMDYGYMAVNALFNEARLPYTVFLLVTSFWILWCYRSFSLRFTKYPILTFILLMNVGVPFPVRQTLSLATMLWGFRFAMDKQWIKFVSVSLGAGLLHKGSFIGIVVVILPYIVNKWRIKWWWYAVAYASTFFIAELFRDSISDAISLIAGAEKQLSSYSEQYMQRDDLSVDFGNYNSSLMNGMGYTLFFVVLLWVREKNKLVCNYKIRHFEVFFFMYSLVAILDNVTRQGQATGMTEVLTRVTATIDMFPIIFPLFFTVFLGKLTRRNTIIVWGAFSLYMSYKFWNQIPGSFFNFLYIPYHSIFYL